MMDRRLFISGALALASCKHESKPVVVQPPSGPLVVRLDASAWDIGPIISGRNYSEGMPPHPDWLGNNGGQGWSFRFPQAPSSVHYVTTQVSGSLAGRSLDVLFAIDGNATLQATEGDATARVRLYLQRRGDNWSAAGTFESYRWWSVSHVELLPGGYHVTVPMTPDAWSNAMGRLGDDPAVTALFWQAISDVQNLGITFGGSFAGHGVRAIGGDARFVMQDFAVR